MWIQILTLLPENYPLIEARNMYADSRKKTTNNLISNIRQVSDE
jgi:hypothetical protein